MQDKANMPSDLSGLMKAIDSPAGKQLMALFRQDQNQELKQAMDQAAQGDYAQAKTMINQILSTPEAAALIAQLQGE